MLASLQVSLVPLVFRTIAQAIKKWVLFGKVVLLANFQPYSHTRRIG